jgi:hypothetical protein
MATTDASLQSAGSQLHRAFIGAGRHLVGDMGWAEVYTKPALPAAL